MRFFPFLPGTNLAFIFPKEGSQKMFRVFRIKGRNTIPPIIVALVLGTLAPVAEWNWFHCFTAPSGQAALLTWQKVAASVAVSPAQQRLLNLAILP
jgi:hypothetical protein